MGRDLSTVEVAITVDLKNRCGITKRAGIPVGKIGLSGARFSFTETDFNSEKKNVKADEVFDKYFGDVIYPAVQLWRYIEPWGRVNVNITLTWNSPYTCSYTKYYTGEYITVMMALPKFKYAHHAYYVARALMSATPMKEVNANLAFCCNKLYVPKTDYLDVIKLYQQARKLGNQLCGGCKIQTPYTFDMSKFIVHRSMLVDVKLARANNKLLELVYNNSPKNSSDTYDENGVIQF